MDILTIEVLEDGTIKTTSGRVSMPNHSNAENFLKGMAEQAGGTVERRRRLDVNTALHVHDHQHGKEEHTH